MDLKILENRDRSGIEGFHTLTPKSSQLFEKVSSDQPTTDPIYRPIAHVSALKQATGEATYVDDIPKYDNELYAALVLSTKAHAKIISIDASEALKQPGVYAFYCANDVEVNRNFTGPMINDEEVFRRDIVTSQGQTLGIILGDDQNIAQRAAKMVKVKYEELSPVVVTIEDAIKYKSHIPNSYEMHNYGNVEEGLKEADFIIDGEARTGGQEHFYMEPHSIIAVPRDNDELQLFSSTQQPCEMQFCAARFLGIPQNKIVCSTKRIGGGFGGKM
jgi:xanthine dehydrogenase/oxidase